MVTVVVVALATATLLDSQGALAAAQEVRYPAVRTPLVTVLRPVDRVAEAIGLDVPYDALARAFGNPPVGSSETDPDGLAAKAKALARHAARPAGPSPSPSPSDRPSPIPYLVDGVPAPAALPQPEPGHPLRVLVTGDSMAGEPGYALSDLLGSADRSDLDVHDEPYAGTGLTRPDAFDWSRKAASQAATEHPDVAVIFLGENDGFPLDGVSPYSADWQRLYSARVQAVIDAYQAGGVKLVIWAAPPIDAQTNAAEGSNVNAIFRNIEAAVRDAVGAVPATAMVDQYDLFSVGGRYSAAVPDPTTGATVTNARLADGSHLTRAGGMIVARLLLRYLDREAAQRNQQAEAAQRGDPAKPDPAARRSAQPERKAGPSPAPGPSRADGAPAVGSGREDAGPTGSAPRADPSPEHPARPLGLVLIVVALAAVYGRGIVTRRLLRGRLAANPLARRIRGAQPNRQVPTRPYIGARSRGTHSQGPDTVTATGRVGTVPPTRPVSSPTATGVPPENSPGTPLVDPLTGDRAGGGPTA